MRCGEKVSALTQLFFISSLGARSGASIPPPSIAPITAEEPVKGWSSGSDHSHLSLQPDDVFSYVLLSLHFLPVVKKKIKKRKKKSLPSEQSQLFTKYNSRRGDEKK